MKKLLKDFIDSPEGKIAEALAVIIILVTIEMGVIDRIGLSEGISYALATQLSFIIITCVIAYYLKKNPLANLTFPTPKLVAIAIGVYVIKTIVGKLIMMSGLVKSGGFASTQEFANSFSMGHAIIPVIIAPIAEELLFKWGALELIKLTKIKSDKVQKWAYSIVVPLIFTLLHFNPLDPISNQIAMTIVIMVPSVILWAYYWETEDLTAPLLYHILNNLIVVLVIAYS